MVIVLSCSKCGKKLQVPDQYAGKRLKCPACQQEVSFSSTTGLSTRSQSESPSIACDSCGEAIPANAKICPACNEPTNTIPQPPTNAPSITKAILWLLLFWPFGLYLFWKRHEAGLLFPRSVSSPGSDGNSKWTKKGKVAGIGCLAFFLFTAVIGGILEASMTPEQRQARDREEEVSREQRKARDREREEQREQQRMEKAVRVAELDSRPRKYGVTKEGFDAIEIGMGYKDVKTILGSGGDLSSEMGVSGHSAKIYTWKKGRSGANMVIIFENDRVTNKTQVGF